MDRRAIFFFGAALACAVLVPVTPDEFRYVGVVLAAVYLVLAVLSLLDDRTRNRL